MKRYMYLLITVLITILILAPIVAICGINMLFGVDIQYSLINWFAMLSLIVIFGAKTGK